MYKDWNTVPKHTVNHICIRFFEKLGIYIPVKYLSVFKCKGSVCVETDQKNPREKW